MSEMAAHHRREAANTSARRKESVLTPDAYKLRPSSARKFPQMTTLHFFFVLGALVRRKFQGEDTLCWGDNHGALPFFHCSELGDWHLPHSPCGNEVLHFLSNSGMPSFKHSLHLRKRNCVDHLQVLLQKSLTETHSLAPGYLRWTLLKKYSLPARTS